MPVAVKFINNRSIFNYPGEELKDWIKYFEKYLANQAEDDAVTINGTPIDEFERECIKSSLRFLERLADKRINGSKIVNDCLRRYGTLIVKDVEENKSERKFPCQQCEYQANKKDHLKNHVESKHGEEIFSCPQCDLKTTANDYLRRHVRSKHKGIEYQCQECVYKASKNSHLKEHVQSKHGGVKYPCQECDFQAKFKSSLGKHVQAKHKGIKHSCQNCNYKATRNATLRKHIKSKHPTL